jgi:RNA polymerase sigma factor (sigma-70 family)
VKSKAEIIDEAANNKELKAITRKIAGDANLADDLFQELMLILLEYNEFKLAEIYAKNYFKWFLVKTLTNQFNSKTSKFYYNYKKNNLEPENNKEIPEPEVEEGLVLAELEYALTAIDVTTAESKDQHYERSLLKLYFEVGSFRKLSAQTGIPYKTIQYTVKRIITELKQNAPVRD